MKRYDKYIESDIEWIGQIPTHWDSTRLKFLGESIIGIIYSPDNVVNEGEGILVLRSSNIQDGKLAFEDCIYVNKEVQEKHLVKKGDILLCARNGSAHLVGKAAYIEKENEGVTFGAFMSIVRSKLDKYLFYFFNSQIFKAQTGLFSTSTINQLTSDTLNNMFISFPRDEQEQITIANYLDRKTAEIDELIADKKRMLELYEEEKTAIINQAVTKGINPDVFMKDSGIDWLGGIPEHWELLALKRITTKITDGEHISPILTSDGMPFLSAKDVRDGYVQFPEDKFVKMEDGIKFRKRCNPEIFDVLMVSRGATVGRVAIVDSETPFCLLGSVILLKPNIKVIGQYLLYSLKNKLLQENFLMSSQSSAQQAIYLINIADVHIGVPLEEEQQAIVRHIKTACARIDTKKSRTEKLIELLTEYRTALISEVVTGKIKVGD